ncbi:rRNA pseudouridine synthase [Nocardia blacklockiae]|nr:rRNA pseudouridine synthase [Nocardia blacklockiae]
MNTPARRDGTPDRRKGSAESPRGGSRGRGAPARGGRGRGDDGYSARGGYSSREGDKGSGYSKRGNDTRGGYSSRGGDGGYSGRGGSGGQDDRGGFGARRGSDRDDYSRGTGSGGGRTPGRGGYGQGGSGQGRGGYSSERGGNYQGRGGYSSERGGGSQGWGGYSRDRGGFTQDRGGYSGGRGESFRGGRDERGAGRGRPTRASGFGADRGGSGGSGRGYRADQGAQPGRGESRSLAGKPSIGGGRPLTPKPAPSRKPKPQRKPPTVLSFAKPARHQHVEEPQNGPTKLPWGEGERLQKVLAKAGVASRRAAEELIEQGRVEVDGAVVREQGLRIDPDTAVVRVDGVRVVVRDEQVYLALNKPKGYQSTMSDELGRPCVGDIVAERVMAGQRLFHVGRLDAETEGLLLLTNDGDLAHRLMHPSFEVSKTYLASVNGEVQRGVGKRLREGVELDDGPAKVDKFQVLEVGEGKSLVRIVLHEGRKHIVRRLLAEVGHPVDALVRTNIGPVALGDQRPGTLRVLGRDEIGKLYEAVAL